MSFAAQIGEMLVTGPKRLLRQEEMKILLLMTAIAKEPPEVQIEYYKSVMPESMGLCIMHKRIEAHFGENHPFSIPAVIWLSTLADRPGNTVLLVALLAHLKEQGRELSLNSLMDHAFGDGVPIDKSYERAWKAQKVTQENLAACGIHAAVGDNMLDQPEAWA